MSEQGESLLSALKSRPLVMDAAMGSRLIARGLSLEDPSDCSAIWNVTHPEDVAAVHAVDIAAGADVLLTNTFLANRIWLEPRGYGNRVKAINRWAASMAREAAGPDRFVVGSIGPAASDDASGVAYREQAESLADAGVDALLLETHTPSQAVEALESILDTLHLPVMVSLHNWSRGDILGSVRNFEWLGVSAVGVNCVASMRELLLHAKELRKCTKLPLLFRPSTVPSSLRKPTEDETFDAFVSSLPMLLNLGARLIGGCCGTTEAHVAAIRAACYDWMNATSKGRDPDESPSTEAE